MPDREQHTKHYVVEAVPLYHRKVLGLDPDMNNAVDLRRLDPRGGEARYQCACGRFFETQKQAIDHLRERYLDNEGSVLTDGNGGDS